MSRNCNACAHSRSAEISKAAAAGVSFREISSRYGITVSAAQRHCVKCLRLVRSAERRSQGKEQVNPSDSSRFENGRCPTCGLMAEGQDHATTLRRLERTVTISETIAIQAQQDNDARMALMAARDVRAALETMAKATGLIGGDVNVVVTQAQRERQTVGEALKVVLAEIPAELWQVAVLDVIQLAMGAMSELPERSRNLLALPITIDAGENGTRAALNPG
jgi:hypothetical protein